jgi:tetratricopeptide (TPR) repeat protein
MNKGESASRNLKSRSRGRVLVILIGILVLGGVLRLFYLHERKGHPDFTIPIADAEFHDYMARGLAFGEWTPPMGKPDPHIRTSPYFRPPGYPYFLALIYKLTGRGYLWSRIIQFCLGLLNVLLAYWLTRRWFGTVVGLIHAGLMATYWAFIYFEGELHAPVIVIGLLLASIQVLALWTERITFRRALFAGLLLGITALMRPSYLLLFPAALIWAFFLIKPDKNWRRLGTAFVGLLVGGCIAILPATIRNTIAANEFVLISSNAGINLYMGNNEEVNGTCPAYIPYLGPFRTCYDYPQLKANLERKLGKPITHSEFSSALAKKAFQFILDHPGKALRLTARKALLLLGPLEVSHNKVVNMDRATSTLLSHIPGNFPIVFAFALLGLLFLVVEVRKTRKAEQNLPIDLQKRWQVSKLIILVLLAWFVSILPFFATARYRAPIIPFFLLFAAYAVYQLWNIISSRDIKRAAVWIAVGLGIFIVVSINYAGYTIDQARWHYARGCGYAHLQKLDLAADEMRNALRVSPDYPDAHIDFGVILLNQGKTDESIQHLLHALRIWPNSAIAHFNLGAAYATKGELDLSIHHFRETLRFDPNFQGAREALQKVRAAKARWFQ